MKIAIVSDDEKTISHHLGRALGLVIFDIENNKVVSRTYRKNIGKSTGECSSCDHLAMINNVKDCEMVISYGMGQRIYSDLTNNNITPIVTEERTVDEALNQFLKKQLKNHIDKLH